MHIAQRPHRFACRAILWIGLGMVSLITANAYEFTATRFRFKPTKLRGGGTAIGTGFQISEFKFMHNGAQVPWGTATLTALNGTSPATETVNNIKDGSPGTPTAASKWYASATSTTILPNFYVTFPSATTVDSYAFATANDEINRDPISWELAYTNVTGTPIEADWIKIDVRTNFATTTDRRTFNPNLTIPQDLPPTIQYFDAMSPDGIAKTTSVVRNGQNAGLLLSQSGADTWAITPGPGELNVYDAVVTPPANKDTEYTLSVTNTADTLTAKRTLRAVAGGSVAYKYVRFRPLALRGTVTGTTQIQIADLVMWANKNDSDEGNDVLVKPKAARNLTGINSGYNDAPPANNEGPTSLIDAVSSTKWLSNTALMNVVMDMTDASGNAMPFDGYTLTTGNDAPDRTPIRWILEGADTDTTTTVWKRIDDLSLWDVSMPTSAQTLVEFPVPGASLPPIVNTFYGDAIKVVAGDPVKFTWTTTDAASVTLTPSPGAVDLSGSLVVNPTESATYTLTASSPAGFNTVKTFNVTVIPTAPDTISYPTFDAATDEFAQVGVAAIVGDYPAAGAAKRLRLTPDITGLNGAAWYSKRIQTSFGFDTTFSFQLTKPLNTMTGADGFSFVVQDHPLGNGSLCDEKGIIPNATFAAARALNFKFDTYYSIADGDNANNSAVFQVRNGGTALTTVSLGSVAGITVNTNALTPVSTPPSLTTDPAAPAHTVRITWVPNLLNVWFDGVKIVNNLSVDLNAIGAFNAEGKSWLGFGARTGGYSQNNDVTAWTFASTPPPSLIKITGYGIDLNNGLGSLLWLSEPGKVYRITSSVDCIDFSNVVLGGISSTGAETSAVFSFPVTRKKFFRVEEQP